MDMKTVIGLALAAIALSTSADASWKCPNMYGTYFYYPTVTQCWNWQWDPNGPAEQAAAAEAQRAAAETQRAAAQRARDEQAAAEAQSAADLARLEVQREAARARAIAATRVAAENSPDNVCREPKTAGMVLDAFNSMDWPDGRRAIDIEHLVTIANNGDNYVSCHGVWDLKDGRQIEGTLTVKSNVAGNPIAQWHQEGWQPTLPAAKPDVLLPVKSNPSAIVPAVTDTAATTSASFHDGANDRLTWETWFNGLSGEERDGAYYWSAQRSLKNPGDCARLGGLGEVGCAEAKARLAPSDARRKSDPDYKAGWNSIHTN
jgi:hypothetical protein